MDEADGEPTHHRIDRSLVALLGAERIDLVRRLRTEHPCEEVGDRETRPRDQYRGVLVELQRAHHALRHVAAHQPRSRRLEGAIVAALVDDVEVGEDLCRRRHDLDLCHGEIARRLHEAEQRAAAQSHRNDGEDQPAIADDVEQEPQRIEVIDRRRAGAGHQFARIGEQRRALARRQRTVVTRRQPPWPRFRTLRHRRFLRAAACWRAARTSEPPQRGRTGGDTQRLAQVLHGDRGP